MKSRCIVQLLQVLKLIGKKTNNDKKIIFKTIGKIQNPKWKKALRCKCHKTDLELQHPFIECNYCKFTERENSCPTEIFERKNIKGEIVKIKEITLTYGKFDDLIGWGWN